MQSITRVFLRSTCSWQGDCRYSQVSALSGNRLCIVQTYLAPLICLQRGPADSGEFRLTGGAIRRVGLYRAGKPEAVQMKTNYPQRKRKTFSL